MHAQFSREAQGSIDASKTAFGPGKVLPVFGGSSHPSRGLWRFLSCRVPPGGYTVDIPWSHSRSDFGSLYLLRPLLTSLCSWICQSCLSPQSTESSPSALYRSIFLVSDRICMRRMSCSMIAPFKDRRACKMRSRFEATRPRFLQVKTHSTGSPVSTRFSRSRE